MRDERSFRREGFDPSRSEPVVLSDGGTWFLPKPWLAIAPVFEGGVPVDYSRYLTQGPELDALIGAIGEAGPFAMKILAGMGLAANMLLRNYDLSDAELAELLVYRPGDPASEEMLESVISVATGRSGKKASPAGGGSR